MLAMDVEEPPNTVEIHGKASWFEFLLNDSLLEEHITKENPDPTPTDLIILFLHQADVAVAAAREARESAPPTPDMHTPEEKPEVEPKKALALRLLALKVAAHLGWSLEKVNNSVPLAMVCSILLELLRATMPADREGVGHTQLDVTTLPDHAVFALQLYHRWCIRTVIKDSFPVKPSKVVNVQIPGLLDPNMINAGARDMVLKTVGEGLGDSVVVLEKVLGLNSSVTIPTLHCFGSLNENTALVSHDWSKGRTFSAQELRCQICYDLGCVYFFQENYSKAGDMFVEVTRLFDTVKPDSTSEINADKLKGYSSACHSLKMAAPASAQIGNLFTKIETAKNENCKAVAGLLLEDNHRQEVSLSYRISLEEEFTNQRTMPEQGLIQVQMCNLIRQVQEGRVVPHTTLFKLYSLDKNQLAGVFQIFVEGLKQGSYTQRKNVSNYIRYLCESAEPNSILFQGLSPLLDSGDCNKLSQYHQERAPPDGFSLDQKTTSTDTSVQQGIYERQLLASYDPQLIRSLVSKLLKAKMPRHQIMFLSDQWRLGRDLQRVLDNLPEGLIPIYTHILLCKARTCVQLKMFDKAHELYMTADSAIKDLSYKVSRLTRWEVLNLDILQYQHTQKLAGDQTPQDVIKKAKTCITSLQLEQDLQPSKDTLASCIGFLLSIKDWDYVINLTNTTSGYLEIGRLIAVICKELPTMGNTRKPNRLLWELMVLPTLKGVRKPARELWDAVLLVFTNSQQQKRSGSGNTNYVHRESNMGVLPQATFISFLHKIQESLILSVLMSCLTKLYNIIKDDITVEISSDYLTIWPTTLLSSVSSLNGEAVTDAVLTIMECALKYDPKMPSWLRTQADIYYAHGQYSKALKSYLESGVVITDYFTDPISQNVYDDQVYKRMIKCCSYLQCHTQVAVLCQFLEEVDYSTAFVALQEPSRHDAMDAYYDFFWDVTILEYLINLHAKKGEMDKKQLAMRQVGKLELNASNPPEILQRASQQRKSGFLRTMAKQYL